MAAHLIRPQFAPQRPVMMSEHLALVQAAQSLERELQQVTCRLNALANFLGARQTITEHKDEHGNVTAITFGFVPAIVGSGEPTPAEPQAKDENHASADALAQP